MKKLMLALFAILMVGVDKCIAQKSLIATLSHDEDITTYYGSKAFNQAYNSAVDGDVITLSSGQFEYPGIGKAITIRGAGMDGENATILTSTNNTFGVTSPSGSEKTLLIEGISFSGRLSAGSSGWHNTTIKKCKIKSLIVPSNSSLTLINTRVTGFLDLSEGNNWSTASENCNISCINCIIRNPYKGSANSTFNFINCVLYVSNPFWSGSNKYADGSRLTYSLFENTFATFSFPESSVVNNSATFSADTNIFKNFSGSFTEDDLYELTDAAKLTNVGSDETEMGIHGGIYPWNSLPAYPQITKFDVSKKVSADDKLSVDISVNGAE